MPKPLCFMVMPYGRKPTQAEAGKGPAEIDFNALWDRAYVPVITELGYEPVRADQDNGALIVTQMLERLYHADLVLADMTVANGNVYYEVGIRHAAREHGCVLLAADWSRQLFDAAQLRTLRYPLPEGTVTPETAQAIRRAIAGSIPALARGQSPMHGSVPGYPARVDLHAASTMKDQMAQLAAFQAQVRAVRAAPMAEHPQRTAQLLAAHGAPPMTPAVAIALVALQRDAAQLDQHWRTLLAFIDALPPELQALAEVREQRALALSKTGQHTQAIAELEALVATAGPTQERLGLLGGRYKRLWQQAATASDRSRALARAIDCYERGMELDLNEYYCASNLPRLYRVRRTRGDEERAQAVLRTVMAACERSRKRGATDPWLRSTLLVAAFDAGDADKAEELLQQVLAEGPAAWQIDSIYEDLRTSVRHVADLDSRGRLDAVVLALSEPADPR